MFLVSLIVGCGVGSLVTPFWGALAYYTLAVLRPQYLWDWALPMHVRWSLYAAVIFLGAVILHSTRVFRNVRFNPVLGLLGLYAVLVFASMLTAFNPKLAQIWAIEFGKVFLVAAVTSLVLNRWWHMRLLSLAIFASIGLIAYEINHLYLVKGRLDIFHYGYAGFDNNGAGLLIAVGVPFAFALATIPMRGIWRLTNLVAGVLGLMMAHAVLMSYSRGAMVAMGGGVAWMLIHHRPRWKAAALIVPLAIALMVMAGPEIRQEIISTKDYKTDESAQSRFASWAAGWQIAWEHPLMGAGIRNSNMFTGRYGADQPVRTIHNLYLQVSADSGIPAGLTLVTMIGLAVYRFGASRRMLLNHADSLSDAEANDGRPGTTGGGGGLLTYFNLLDHPRAAASLMLAAQGSLLTFAAAAMLLSVEAFEVSWLLIIMGGCAPIVARDLMAPTQDAGVQSSEPVRAANRPAHYSVSNMKTSARNDAAPGPEVTPV